MQDLERYTPEMLVYYNTLEEPLKSALRLSNLPVDDMESLAAAAEMLAQSGHAGNGLLPREPARRPAQGAAFFARGAPVGAKKACARRAQAV